MLRSRIIPCLLIHRGGLVKTVGFKDPKYVGDPINAVKIFNEKEVDELMVLDIDASVNGTEPDFKLIENLAAECRMPLCYGGGIKNEEQAAKVIALGAEKVAFSSALVDQPELAARLAKIVGRQSVVFVIDVKRNVFGKYGVYTHNGSRNTKLDPFDLARRVAAFGVGEIVVNSIDHDGAMEGYDLRLAQEMRDAVDVPMTVLGGAGSLDDIRNLVDRFKIIGAAAGSLFVFKGRYRAVLINYPTVEEKRAAFKADAAA